jgi:gliding motility-associated-like protein
MKNQKVINSILILAFLLGLSLQSNAQIYSQEKDWAGLTSYTKVGAIQDSIFVFFSSTASPKKGTLRAKFSDDSKSSYTWYKFDESHPSYADPFVQISQTDSVLTDLSKGGYRVSVKRISDDSTEVYTCWVFIDEVVITTMNIYNGCDYLELKTITSPTALSIINYNVFSYWDLSKTNHAKIGTFGSNYLKNLTWSASNSQISVSSISTLTLVLENPAPSYDSKYAIRIENPFGRILTYETDLLPAKAPKADFTIYVDSDGTWSDGGENPEGEAPLKLKLESKSVNTDSIYWRIINDETLFLQGGDSIVWRDSAIFTDRIESYPTPEKMIPGTYPVEHIALKENSGCRDTMTIYVLVDTSGIKTNAIPNVFSPNDDGSNDCFKIILPETNVSSIKSFHVYIFNRGGLRVYDYSGDPKTWEGWNGKINGNKGNAAEGVYFYIFEAVGWDNKSFRGGKYKGFFYLYRGK